MDFIKQAKRKAIDWLNPKSTFNVSSIPIELHLPGYQFCGPGTKYNDRVAAGQTGINSLDNACMKHDAVYNSAHEVTPENRKRRAEADDQLIAAAQDFRKNAGFKDKLGAYATEGAMRAKKVLGIF